MYISAMSTVLNAVFNYGLIFGKLGMPELGIEGAAIATCISAWANPVFALLIALYKKLLIVASPEKIFKFTRERVRSFYKKAAPVIINESMWGLGTFVMTLIYSNLGSEYYAAVTILKTFENIAFTVFIGICNASCVMVGKEVGAGNIKQAVSNAKRMAMLVPLVALPIGGLIIIFREQLVHLFNMSGNITDLTLNTAIGIITVYGSFIAIRNIPYIQVVGIFRPGGETVRGLIYEMIYLWCFAIPVTAISAYVLKIDFVLVYIIMYIAEDVPKSILCVKYFLTEKWIKPVTDVGVEGLNKYLAEKTTK
jgi:Na+-driven multidrug efflux pump